MNKSKIKTCLIYNYAQHYRASIFSLLDKELDIEFYFGDKMQDVKKMDYSLLSNFKYELKNIKIISSIYWQKGAIKLFFKKYDNYIILGEYYCISTWILLILCKISKKKIYLWTHGWYGRENLWKKIIKKFFFNLGNGVFLYGDYAKKLMILEGFSKEKLHVIYNSLDYELQKKIRIENPKSDVYFNYFNNSYPTLIFTGRLTVEKKLDQLVNATKILKDSGFLLNLVFIGEGNDKINLINKLNSLGIKDYWFYGACYDEYKLGELIFNSSICISPGNVGLTAMHSLVYGTPLITHSDFTNQGPEFESIIPGVTGDFFTKDDEIDLSNKIKNWLLNSDNRELIRQNCYKIIDKKYNPFFQLNVIKSVLNQ
jgi:glycosyltransferase involved in cell wall biosynthesis